MDTNIIYDFQVEERVMPEYKVSRTILEWIRGNLQALTDDNTNTIFKRVNLGYNESSLKSLGKKPVADVYITNIEYKQYLDLMIPDKVNTAIIISLKGNANNTYGKALELHDYIMQEFIETVSWRELNNIIKETHINNSEVQINQNNKVWGNLVLFELTHTLI